MSFVPSLGLMKHVACNLFFANHYKDTAINQAGFHASSNGFHCSNADETKASNTQNAWSKVAIKGKVLNSSTTRYEAVVFWNHPVDDS